MCANCLSILYILDGFLDKLIITDHDSPLTLTGCKVFLSKTKKTNPKLLELEVLSIPDSVHTTPSDYGHIICKRDPKAKRGFGLPALSTDVYLNGAFQEQTIANVLYKWIGSFYVAVTIRTD